MYCVSQDERTTTANDQSSNSKSTHCLVQGDRKSPRRPGRSSCTGSSRPSSTASLRSRASLPHSLPRCQKVPVLVLPVAAAGPTSRAAEAHPGSTEVAVEEARTGNTAVGAAAPLPTAAAGAAALWRRGTRCRRLLSQTKPAMGEGARGPNLADR
jgi:hypothetical protein